MRMTFNALWNWTAVPGLFGLGGAAAAAGGGESEPETEPAYRTASGGYYLTADGGHYLTV